MYTLGMVLDLVDAGDDIYCELYRRDRKICEGWLTDLGLDSAALIEAYRVEYDDEGDKYLVLYLA